MRHVTMKMAAVAAALLTAAPALAAERAWPVTGFDKVKAGGAFDVTVRVGGAPSVRATGPQIALDRLEVFVQDGTLTLRPQKDSWRDWMTWTKREKVFVTVTLPAIRAVSLAGSGDVRVDRAKAATFEAALAGSGDLIVDSIETARLVVSLAGSGDLTVNGRAADAKVTLAGSGDIHGAGLTAERAEVSLAGSGDIALGARRAATVSLVGSGDVVIAGGARCTTSKRGSGDVKCG